jgi:hypothetical protein
MKLGKKLVMAGIIFLAAMLIFGALSIVRANDTPPPITVYGNEGMDLMVKNNKNAELHLFVLIYELGCSKTDIREVGNSEFIIDNSKDVLAHEDGGFSILDTYFEKLSHYEMFVFKAGEAKLIRECPCVNVTDVMYGFDMRFFTFGEDNDWNEFEQILNKYIKTK